jgi:dipeptidyl aminopeptidase/acylaminoacyl peptidase
VKIAESDQIVAAMRANDRSVTYVVFEDEGHGFARPENNLRFTAAMEQFFAEHLGGRAEPPSDGESITAFLR